jgi:Bacterial SH3 domain
MIRIACSTFVRPAFAFLLCLAAALPGWAQEAAVTKRATQLRETPGDSGRGLAALPADAPLTRLNERQGPWVQVRTAAGATGWVHLFDIGPAAGGASAPGGSNVVGGALRGVTGLFGGTTTQQRGTTAGIRGLGAEDLAQAQPNLGAVTRMEALRQSEAEARSFGSGAALQPVAVEPLPAPARLSAPSRVPNPAQQEAQ